MSTTSRLEDTRDEAVRGAQPQQAVSTSRLCCAFLCYTHTLDNSMPEQQHALPNRSHSHIMQSIFVPEDEPETTFTYIKNHREQVLEHVDKHLAKHPDNRKVNSVVDSQYRNMRVIGLQELMDAFEANWNGLKSGHVFNVYVRSRRYYVDKMIESQGKKARNNRGPNGEDKGLDTASAKRRKPGVPAPELRAVVSKIVDKSEYTINALIAEVQRLENEVAIVRQDADEMLKRQDSDVESELDRELACA